MFANQFCGRSVCKNSSIDCNIIMRPTDKATEGKGEVFGRTCSATGYEQVNRFSPVFFAKGIPDWKQICDVMR
jgi:hypothetical protein